LNLHRDTAIAEGDRGTKVGKFAIREKRRKRQRRENKKEKKEKRERKRKKRREESVCSGPNIDGHQPSTAHGSN